MVKNNLIAKIQIVWGYIQGRYPDNVHEPCDTHDLVEGVERVKSGKMCVLNDLFFLLDKSLNQVRYFCI